MCSRAGLGRPASASTSRWPPTSASPPTTRAFWEPFAERGLHARQRRDLAAAPAGRRGRGPGELLLLGRALDGRRGGRAGDSSTAPCAADRARRRRADALVDAAGGRADRRARPDEVAAATPVATAAARRAPAERGASRWSCRRAARTSARASRRSARSATRTSGPLMTSDARRRRIASTRPTLADRGGVDRSDWVDGQRARPRGATPRRAGGASGDPRGAARAPTTRRGTRRSAASGLVVPDLAGRVRRPRRHARVGPRDRGRARARSTSAGSTRSGSTSPRRRCSPTAPRSSGCGSCRRSCATRRSGASCSASRAPAPTWRRSPRAPSATATSGCSPARRCGPRGRTCPTSACCLARTDPDVAEAQGHHLLPRRPATSRASTCGRCATSPARSTSTRCSSTRCACPTPTGSATIGDGWRVANATLSGERQMVSGSGSGGVDRIGGVGRRAPRSARRAVGRRTAGRLGRPGRAPAAHAAVQRGAHPRLDEPAGAGRAQGRPPARARRARSARCTRAR